MLKFNTFLQIILSHLLSFHQINLYLIQIRFTLKLVKFSLIHLKPIIFVYNHFFYFPIVLLYFISNLHYWFIKTFFKNILSNKIPLKMIEKYNGKNITLNFDFSLFLSFWEAFQLQKSSTCSDFVPIKLK